MPPKDHQSRIFRSGTKLPAWKAKTTPYEWLYELFWSEIKIALRYRKKVALNLFLYRITKIILSKQWFYTFFNMFNSVKKHNN